MSPIQLSLVVPVYNEAGNVLPLVASSVEVLRAMGRPFEIILVNDGSTDTTGDDTAAVNKVLAVSYILEIQQVVRQVIVIYHIARNPVRLSAA